MTLAQWDNSNGQYVVHFSSNPATSGNATNWQLNTSSGTEAIDAITSAGGALNIINHSGVDDVLSIEVIGPTNQTYANGLGLNPLQRILVT